VHGTADDNVFFLHSLKLVDALEKSRRPFEFLPLQGITHQLASPDMAELVWTRTVMFLRAHLQG
jgi:dipeptidyl-peptidase-4